MPIPPRCARATPQNQGFGDLKAGSLFESPKTRSPFSCTFQLGAGRWEDIKPAVGSNRPKYPPYDRPKYSLYDLGA